MLTRRVHPVLILLLALALPPRLVAGPPEVYFSPTGGIQSRLLRAINLTKTRIDLALFDFTSGELAGALLNAQARGVAIRIVADARQAEHSSSEIPLLRARGVPVRLGQGRGRGIMHHKFALFDGTLLATGSYNWTGSAERFNHENLVVLDDPALIRAYQTRFEELWRESLPGPPGAPIPRTAPFPRRPPRLW